MPKRPVLLSLAALAGVLAPSHATGADEPWILLQLPGFYDRSFGSPLAGAACRALATPYRFQPPDARYLAPSEAPTWVPLAVRVTCNFNGTETSAMAPGAVATAPVVLVTSGAPYRICGTAEAAFVNTKPDSGEIRLVTVSGCTTLPS